jgi:hypothetical protein
MTDDRQLSPDAEIAVHLIKAGREILAAARSAIDTLDGMLEIMEQKVGTPAETKAAVEPIPIRRPATSGP